MNIVYLNGEFVEKDQASVSIFDRGLLFGDAVYEVIPYFNGHALGVVAHLERLNQSLKDIHMKPALNHDEWIEVFEQLVARNQPKDGLYSIYLQVTRGHTTARHHAIPTTLQPTVFAFLVLHHPLDKKQGYRAITLPDQRHGISHIKSTNLMANILAFEQAKKANAIEAILYRGEHVIECTCSNVFMVKNRCVYTPPLQPFMLAGITRRITIDIVQQNRLELKEQPILLQELKQADEIWITSSTKTLLPIVFLDDRPINNGTPGELTVLLQNKFDEYINNKEH